MLLSIDSKMFFFRRRSKELLVRGESERKGKHIKGSLHKKSSTVVLEKQCRHQLLVEEVCFEGHIITWTVVIPNIGGLILRKHVRHFFLITWCLWKEIFDWNRLVWFCNGKNNSSLAYVTVWMIKTISYESVVSRNHKNVIRKPSGVKCYKWLNNRELSTL